MTKDPKRIKFENKEQLIEILNLIIELTDKHFYRYSVYYEELFKIVRKDISGITGMDEALIEEKYLSKTIKKMVAKESYREIREKYKMNYIQYKTLEDRMCNVQAMLLNLLGDKTKNGISYWRFRKEYNNLQKIIEIPVLEELSQETNEIINSMGESRNYLHHMTDAKFIEWINFRKKQQLDNPMIYQKWPSDTIYSDRAECVSVEWIWQLMESQIDFKNGVKILLQQMKKDYSRLYGSNIKIERRWRTEVDNSAFAVSINGFERHKGKIK